MEPSETPFRAAWWGPGLPGLRPHIGTYGHYDYQPLVAPADVPFNGSFDWLRREPSQRSSILEDDRCDLAAAFAGLSRHAAILPLPPAFLTFLKDHDLPRRIRSSTACFVDLATEAFPSPKDGGSLIRFLSDQQGCVFWYLFVPLDGNDHCIVASPDYFGPDADAVNPPGVSSNPNTLVYCAPSFEAFIFRFWIENEYWYASHGRGTLTPTADRYVRSLGWTPPAAPPAARPNWFRRFLRR